MRRGIARGRVHAVLLGSGHPAAAEYLASIGVDPATSVRLIIATHWHDDDIAGLFVNGIDTLTADGAGACDNGGP
jgi:hypothetical protein